MKNASEKRSLVAKSVTVKQIVALNLAAVRRLSRYAIAIDVLPAHVLSAGAQNQSLFYFESRSSPDNITVAIFFVRFKLEISSLFSLKSSKYVRNRRFDTRC
ncbi:MAG: hypothetical protein AAFQ14_18810 [Cyanobacteria bacterium J06621_12]